MENLFADLFMWSNNSYVIFVDFYSIYFEVAILNATTSIDVIHQIKLLFSKRGIPKSILTLGVYFFICPILSALENYP